MVVVQQGVVYRTKNRKSTAKKTHGKTAKQNKSMTQQYSKKISIKHGKTA
jgi:hypothetical protein